MKRKNNRDKYSIIKELLRAHNLPKGKCKWENSTHRNTIVIFKNIKEKENSKIYMKKLSNKKRPKQLKNRVVGVYLSHQMSKHIKSNHA